MPVAGPCRLTGSSPCRQHKGCPSAATGAPQLGTRNVRVPLGAPACCVMLLYSRSAREWMCRMSYSMSWEAISQAAPRPMASGAGTVPLRRPRSCSGSVVKGLGPGLRPCCCAGRAAAAADLEARACRCTWVQGERALAVRGCCEGRQLRSLHAQSLHAATDAQQGSKRPRKCAASWRPPTTCGPCELPWQPWCTTALRVHDSPAQASRSRAPHLAAAAHLGLYPDAGPPPDVQRPDALGPVQLVRGDGHQVHAQLVHVHWHLHRRRGLGHRQPRPQVLHRLQQELWTACSVLCQSICRLAARHSRPCASIAAHLAHSLGSVGVEEDLVLLAHARNLLDGLLHACNAWQASALSLPHRTGTPASSCLRAPPAPGRCAATPQPCTYADERARRSHC